MAMKIPTYSAHAATKAHSITFIGLCLHLLDCVLTFFLNSRRQDRLQPSPFRGSGCNISHSGLPNVNGVTNGKLSSFHYNTNIIIASAR